MIGQCLQADTTFTGMLADIRSGRCPAQTLIDLQSTCSRALDTSDGILPTQVCSSSCIGCDWRGPHTADQQWLQCSYTHTGMTWIRSMKQSWQNYPVSPCPSWLKTLGHQHPCCKLHAR